MIKSYSSVVVVKFTTKVEFYCFCRTIGTRIVNFLCFRFVCLRWQNKKRSHNILAMLKKVNW
jgi:hypothetical protein